MDVAASGDRTSSALACARSTWSRLSIDARVALAAGLYALIHAGVQRLTSSAVTSVDALSNVFAQRWALVYNPENPPLYDWLLRAVQTVLGAGPAGFLALKITASMLTAYAVMRVSHRLGNTDQDGARIGVFALLLAILSQPYGWTYHEMITHSVALIALCPLALLCFMRFVEGGRWADALALGVVCGLGLLAKYNFAVLMGLLIVVGVMRADTRARLLSARFATAIALGLAMFAPYGWAALQPDMVADTVSRTPLQPAEMTAWAARPLAVVNVALASLAFIAPAVFIAAACFPCAMAGVIRAGPWRAGQTRVAAAVNWYGFLTLYLGIGIAVIAVVAGGLGLTALPLRYLHPVHLFLLVWLAASVQRFGVSPKAWRRFVAIAVFSAAAVVLVRAVAFAFPTEGLCDRRCRWMTPYDQLAERLTADGAANAWIVSADTNAAGNLRAVLAGAAIYNLHTPGFAPSAEGPARVCILVWEEGGYTAPVTRELIETHRDYTLPFVRVAAQWRPGWWARGVLEDGFRTTPWAYVTLKPNAPVCQAAFAGE